MPSPCYKHNATRYIGKESCVQNVQFDLYTYIQSIEQKHKAVGYNQL